MPGSARTPREVFERLGQEWLGDAPEALGDFAAGLWAEDVVVETPFNPPGTPRRVEGREAFHTKAAAGRAALPVRFEEIRNITIHETTDPEVIVVEYELAAISTTTGRRSSAPFIGVLRARDGQIVHWREYQNVPAIAAALDQLPALLAKFSDQQPDATAAPVSS